MQGSLASMLGAAGTAGAGAFAELLARLELAASDDDKDDYAALVIQRAYRAAVRRRGPDAPAPDRSGGKGVRDPSGLRVRGPGRRSTRSGQATRPSGPWYARPGPTQTGRRPLEPRDGTAAVHAAAGGADQALLWTARAGPMAACAD